MAYSKKYLIIGCAILWALIIVTGGLLIFFPYEKIMKVIFNEFVGGGSTRISFVDGRKGFAHGGASKVIVGHEAIEGKPFYVLEKVVLTWNPLSILTGVANVSANTSLYGGRAVFKVADLPVLAGSVPKLGIVISNLNLGGYPKETVPWFKSISGVMAGDIRKEVRLLAREQEKGSFSFRIKDGEIKDVPIKDNPELSLLFKEIAVEGRIKGARWEMEKIVVNGSTFTIKGSGYIEERGADRIVDVKLGYEATGQGGPLEGKGTIAVTGSVWSPEAVVTREAGAQSIAAFEKSEFFRKYKAKDKKSTPLKPTGTNFAYTYPDGEDKNGEVEVGLAPDPQAIERISVSWRGKSPAKFPEFSDGRQEFLINLLKFYDPAMETDELIAFVESQQTVKYPGGESAMKKEKIGKVLVRAGIVGNALVVGIEKAK